MSEDLWSERWAGQPRSEHGVATPAREGGPWQGISAEEWIDKFRQNAGTQPGASPRVPSRERALLDRTATTFPFVDHGRGGPR
jgi:hypothetical protein